MSLWDLSLIKCSTTTFLTDVGHITHTCTQQSPPQVRVHQFIMLAPQAKTFSSVTLFCLAIAASLQRNSAPDYLVKKTFDTRSWLNPSSNLNSDTIVGSRGNLGGRPHLGQSSHTSERDTILLPKTLRQ